MYSARKNTRERHARVLDVEAGDDLRLAFGDVERCAVGLRDAGDEVDEEQRKQRPDVPVSSPQPPSCPRTISPRFRLLRGHQHADQREAHRDLVGHDLRRRAQRAEERVLRVRRPAGDDDAVDAHRRHREDVEQPGVDVRRARACRLNGTTAHAASAGMIASIGASTNRNLFAPDGTMISLNSSLSTSANGCSRPERPDAVGADAHLHPADHLALPERQVGDRTGSAAATIATILASVQTAGQAGPKSCSRLARIPSRRRTFCCDGHALDADRAEHRAERRGLRMRRRRGGRSRPARRRRRRPRATASPPPCPRARDRLRASPGVRAARGSSHATGGARIARLLQRRRAAHERIGGIDRHVGDALQPVGGSAPAPASRGASMRLSSCAASHRPRPAALSRTSLRRCRRRSPASPSIVPSTRSTFHAGPRFAERLHARRESSAARPSQLTNVPAVSVNGAIGSSTSAYVDAPCSERAHRHDELRLLERSARRAPDSRSRTPARHAAAGTPCRGSASIACAFSPAGDRGTAPRDVAADAVGRFAAGSRASRRSDRRAPAPARAAARPRGCCCARLPSSTARPLAARRGSRRSRCGRVGLDAVDAGAAPPAAACPRLSPRRRRSRASASRQLRRRDDRLVRDAASASRRRPDAAIETCAPFFAACRRRCASSGWSLRSEAADDQHAVELAEVGDRHAEPRRAGALAVGARNRLCRRRKSTLPLPSPRTSCCSRVQLFERRVRRRERADRIARRAVARRRLSPCATNSSAVCQSTSCHSPPRLIIGRVRRSLGVEPLVGEAVLVRQPALVDRLVLERQHAHHAVAA